MVLTPMVKGTATQRGRSFWRRFLCKRRPWPPTYLLSSPPQQRRHSGKQPGLPAPVPLWPIPWLDDFTKSTARIGLSTLGAAGRGSRLFRNDRATRETSLFDRAAIDQLGGNRINATLFRQPEILSTQWITKLRTFFSIPGVSLGEPPEER